MSAEVADLAAARAARCRCAGDGRTWVDVGACPIHVDDPDSSPLMQQLNEAWERHVAAAREAAKR